MAWEVKTHTLRTSCVLQHLLLQTGRRVTWSEAAVIIGAAGGMEVDARLRSETTFASPSFAKTSTEKISGSRRGTSPTQTLSPAASLVLAHVLLFLALCEQAVDIYLMSK